MGLCKKIVILLLFFTTTIKKIPAQSNDPLSYVNPFIGTTTSSLLTKWGSEGGTYPGAVAPFGFIQLTPETRVSGTKSYNFIDSSIYYFSCIQHRSGFPGGSSGRLLIMPVSNEKNFEVRTYHQKFSHQDEKAGPGYYKVLFDDGILSEATASERTGIFRFTFPQGIPPTIFIGDAGEISIQSSQLLYGSNFNSVVKFDKPIVAEQKVKDGSVVKFAYSPHSLTIITVRLSVSGIGFKSAERNIDVESGSTGFDQLKEKTKSKWAKELSVIELDDSNVTNKTIFYTALYHSLLLPWIISDVEGNYLGEDGKVHKTTGSNQYGGFSPWDTFRSLHPLLTLLYPGRQKDMVLSMLDIYKQSGYLPVESMTGNHAIPIIVDSYLKGITVIDKTLAYAAMKKSIVHPPFIQQDMQVYQTQGYIPFSLLESVTRTVEYAYDDWALANYSKLVMHNAGDYKLLLNRSYNYRSLFNVSGLFLLPRNKDEFKLQPGTSGYKEGDKWVYSYFAPHNGKDLINLMGGYKAFVERLDSALTNNLIVFDNETVFHIPYLFNCANEPGKTQQWVNKIMTERFRATPGGLPGNDDLGSMSSWYVFSAMGIYPNCPGRPFYTIGSPLFKSLTMHLENGKKFTIKKTNASNENIYVKSLALNNQVYNKITIPHSSVLKGGGIVFTMDSISNRNLQEDYKNNDLSETIKDASFKVTGYTVSKKKVKPNELFWVFFTVKNEGSLGTKQVGLFVNGKLYGYKNCMIRPNSIITDSMSCRLYPYGKSSIKIESLDSRIVEVISTDSSLSEPLQVSDLFVKPIIKNSEVQNISFTVQNIGGVERSFEIPVLLNDSLVQGHHILLAPGQVTDLLQTITVTREGFYSISVNGIHKNFKVYSINKDAIVLDLDMKINKPDSVVHDRSGFGNDGRVIRTKREGGTSLTTDLLLGKDCFVEIPNSNSLDILKESITMMAWVYPAGKEDGLVDIFTKGDNHVLQVSGNKTLSFFAGGWGRGDCSVDLPSNWLNNWHHIAGVCDGKTLKLYIDGKLGGTTKLEDSVNLSIINKWNLGRNEEFPSERIFNGYMDKVKVFVEPLSASEIVDEMDRK